MDASVSAHSAVVGLQHTHAWTVLHGRLQRLLLCLSNSSTTHEREALTEHFATQLVEQAKEYSAPASQSEGPTSSPSSSNTPHRTNELNSLALLAVASMFDRLIIPRQQTAPQVREVLSRSGPLALKEDDALSTAWSLFVQQASSSLGNLGSGWAAAPAAAPNIRSPPPSPMIDPRRQAAAGESPGPASPMAGRAEPKNMPRNGSELFSFEE